MLLYGIDVKLLQRLTIDTFSEKLLKVVCLKFRKGEEADRVKALEEQHRLRMEETLENDVHESKN